jgi:hypothetical protein
MYDGSPRLSTRLDKLKNCSSNYHHSYIENHVHTLYNGYGGNHAWAWFPFFFVSQRVGDMGRAEYIASLDAEIDALYGQIAQELDSASRLRIRRRIDELEKERSDINITSPGEESGQRFLRLLLARARLNTLLNVAEIVVEDAGRSERMPRWLKEQIQREHDIILEEKGRIMRCLMD